MNKQLLLFCCLESIIQKYISILEVKRCHSEYLSLDFFLSLSLSLCCVKARIYDEWEEQWVMFTRVCARVCVCVRSMKTLLRNYRVWWSCTCTTVYSSQVRWGFEWFSFVLSRAFLLCNLSLAPLLCKKRNYSGRWQQTVTMPTCVCEKGVSMAVSMLL